jgi:hypothetical protein
MKRSCFVFFALVLCSMFSCGSSEKDVKFREFKRYAQDAFNLQELPDGMYFVVQPSCYECAQGVLDMIKDSDCPDLTVISLGSITDANISKMKEIAKGKTLWFDRTNKSQRYAFGIEKGVLMHVTQAQVQLVGVFGSYENAVVKYIDEHCYDR